MEKYKQIIVIGYGVVTGNVLAYVNDMSKNYNYSICYVEHENHSFNYAKKYAEDNGLVFHNIKDKNELTSFFERAAIKEKILIISASNNYIFPKKLVENENIIVVNYHSSLLPDLPGRNAASWAIYKGYKKTGITWHFVTTGIDNGDIIIQKECGISSDIKAYELVAAQMELATHAFREIFDIIINGSVIPIKQETGKDRKIYKSTDVPGDGKFDLKDNSSDIYRLLRALDYGKFEIFPHPKTLYNGKEVIVKRYKKVSLEEKKEGDNIIYLPLSKDTCLKIVIGCN